MKQDRDTEKDIIRAAQKIFQEKGLKKQPCVTLLQSKR